MLRNNLSSRPFYNERGVSLAVGVATLLVLALTAFNATQLWGSSARRAELQASIDRDNTAARQIRTEAATVERGLDSNTLGALLVSTREANSLIDERTFSWTVFFDYIERTLPIDVRLVAVAPRTEKGVFLVEMLVVTRQPEDLESFYQALRATGAFSEVYSTSGHSNDDGTIRVDVEARYHPPKLTTSPAVPAGGRGQAAAGRGGQGGRP